MILSKLAITYIDALEPQKTISGTGEKLGMSKSNFTLHWRQLRGLGL